MGAGGPILVRPVGKTPSLRRGNMKRHNFAGRVKARRESALERRRRDLSRWEHKPGDGAQEKRKAAQRDVSALEGKLGL